MNRVLQVLHRANGPSAGADAERLLDRLTRKYKLADAGDGRFRNGLMILLQAVASHTDLSPLGRRIILHAVNHYLRNRRLIHTAMTRNPDIARQTIRRPLFIVGLNRSGTTLLHNLLALAPDARAPRTWELMQPAPPCDPASAEATRRIRHTRRMLRLLNMTITGLRSMHPIEADSAEECYPLLNHTFVSPAFSMHYGLPLYRQWLDNLPPDVARWAYREYANQLRVLQSVGSVRRWVLKSAVHLYFLDALLDEMPDALIVQTHRDPVQQLPSISTLLACFRNLVQRDFHSEVLGDECLSLAKTALSRGVEARRRHPRAVVVDVHFEELVADPIAQVKRIHEQFGLAWKDAHVQRMRAWLWTNAPDRKESAPTPPEQFGLTADIIRSALSPEDALAKASATRPSAALSPVP